MTTKGNFHGGTDVATDIGESLDDTIVISRNPARKRANERGFSSAGALTSTRMKEVIMNHHGSCFCGAVTLEVSGAPAAMGYCHCASCRAWSGGPVNAFTLWQADAVTVKSGAQEIATFQKTPFSARQYCKSCGGHLMTRHPTVGLVDVFASTIPTLPFQPGVHVNYAETVLRFKDGLPKLKDFPTELGGSGQAVPE